MPTKLLPDKLEEAMTGTLALTSEVQILIPATLVPGLIRALNSQKTVHERRYGPIHEPGAPDAETSSE